MSTANLMRRRVGVAILVAVMVVASLFGLLVGLLFPEGEDGHLTYASVAPDRTFIRTWLLLAALNLIVGLTAFALAGWLLVPARGWIAATVGACLIWVRGDAGNSQRIDRAAGLAAFLSG